MKYGEKAKIVYALSRAQGIGCIKGKKILENTDIADVESFLRTAGAACSAKEYAEIKATISGIDFEGFFEKLNGKGIRLVTVCDDEYPESLRPYADSPLVLYAKGDIALLNAPCFAVIGTRFATKYGARVTAEFTHGLAERFCIVSGLARGMDACAHRAALDVGGKTIAVLGSGLDVIYPPENISLYKDIVTNGGLAISEYEPGTVATARNFPARNRIISGLSKAVLVTEAGLKSGTMLTVEHALKQGKDVFCVPGSIYSKTSAGCNRSIRECQSRAVLDVNDIYDELGLSKTDLSKPDKMQLDFNEELIVKFLEENGETHFEELLENIDLNMSQLSSLLVKMEALGIINKTRYNFWSL